VSDPHDPDLGPVCIAATAFLRRGPARIGRITNNLVLPRTIPVRNLVAGGVGAGVGLIPGALAAALTGTPMAAVFVAAIFAAVAVGLVTATVRGEHLGVWLGLAARSQAGRVKNPDGETVKAYIGLARLDRLAVGACRIEPSAVPVTDREWDERGVPVRLIGRTRRRGKTAT